MRRTITLGVMWQVDPISGEVTDPTQTYRYGSTNCYADHRFACLVEADNGLFMGHIDSDQSRDAGTVLGVYKGEPPEIAECLRRDLIKLALTRQDDFADKPQPAEMVVWLRVFSDEGGVELTAENILWWKHPATQ